MNFVFRADSSLEIGAGHIMRCLALAEGLRKSGSCTFISRDLQGSLFELIKQRGFEIIKLSPSPPPPKNPLENTEEICSLFSNQDAHETLVALLGKRADWIIVDHYSLGISWELALRGSCKKLMVIDDLADRHHECDLLLDQTLGRSAEDYQPFVPITCKLKLGPEFALLDPTFSKLRSFSLKRRTEQSAVKHVLISLGGVDKDGLTKQILDTLNHEVNLPADAFIKIVMGKYAPDIDIVKKRAAYLPWRAEVLVDINTMASEIANSDLVIGSGGISSWERACLGAPALVIPAAKNQTSNIKALEESGSCISVKILCEGILDKLDFIEKLNAIIEPAVIASLRDASSKITEGNGADLVARYLVGNK